LFIEGVEEEGGLVVVDEGAELFGFGAGAGVDVEGHFAHGDAGHVLGKGGVGDAEDEVAEAEPLADEFDVFDFGVGDLDEFEFTFAAGEDVAGESPAEFDVIGEEAEFADDFLPAEGIGGGDGEVDGDGVVFEHGGECGVRILEWGMGNGEWGMGNGEWGREDWESSILDPASQGYSGGRGECRRGGGLATQSSPEATPGQAGRSRHGAGRSCHGVRKPGLRWQARLSG